jgi:hypothetical protein
MIKTYIITTKSGRQFKLMATDKTAALLAAKELLAPDQPINASLSDEW